MSLYGTNAVQAAMLRVLSRDDKSNSSEARNAFAGLLAAQLSVSGQTDTYSTYTQNLISGETGTDMSTLMLLSLLGGGSSQMMASLGQALSSGSGWTSAGTSAATGASSYDLSGLITPERASRPVTPAVRSSVWNRSAQLYTNAIAQFNVESNPRYAVNKKGTGDTYCNIFVWDVTSAMGAEIPYYYNPSTGAPMTYPDVQGANFMSANRMNNWLNNYGSQNGWYRVSAEEAQTLANRGQPVVASLKRNGTSGHVQMVCPSADGQYDEKRGVMIAQAGRNLTSYRPITEIYGKASLSKVEYFAHR